MTSLWRHFLPVGSQINMNIITAISPPSFSGLGCLYQILQSEWKHPLPPLQCCNETINVSVNSKPDYPPRQSPGQFFRWANSPPPRAKRKVKAPTPRAYKDELKPHPGAFSSIIHRKNMKKMKQKSRKTAS